MKSKLRKGIKKFVVILLFLIIFIVVGQLANGKVPSLFGHRIFRVVSQSMTPTISDETCIIIHSVDEDELKKGDIITFVSYDPAIYGYYNTHRIYDIQYLDDGSLSYVTKGDANLLPDTQRVSYSQIIGKYITELPFGAWLAKGLKLLANQKVYFIVIMLPIVICFISYIWQFIGIVTGREEEEDEVESDDHAEDDSQSEKENKDKMETK